MIQIMLLACSAISDVARRELERAECPIHAGVVAGYEGMSDVLIVELQYGSDTDLHVLSVWDHPTEIQIESRDLNLYRAWHAPINGYALVNLDEAHDVARALSGETVEDEPVAWGDLDEHPF